MASSILSVSFSHQQSHMRAHFHDCHQILFITQGSASIQTGSTSYTAQAGDLVLFSRFEQHAVISRSTDYQRYVVKVSPHPAFLSDALQPLFSILSNRPAGFSNVLDVKSQAAEIHRLLNQMYVESSSDAAYSDALMDLWMQELLIRIYRLLPHSFSGLRQEHQNIVSRIQRRFEQEYASSVTLADLAKEYSLSSSHLSHLFKKVTGSSVMGYLLSCRIAAAKKYLAETNMDIGQIVALCGFSDSSNFSRTFRKITGCSPTQFRRHYRQL